MNIENELAKLALKSEKILNIKDINNDSRFSNNDDLKKMKSKIRSILYLPIHGRDGLMGVLEIVNKKNGFFTIIDEKLFIVFKQYIEIGMEHSKLYKKYNFLKQTNLIYKEIYLHHTFTRTLIENTVNSDEIILPTNMNEYSFCFSFKYISDIIDFLQIFLVSLSKSYKRNG